MNGEWPEIILGVLEGSILGPVLFNIFINDLLLLTKEKGVCNFADGTTCSDLVISLENLEIDGNIAMIWLSNSNMVANPKKFQLMFLARNKNIEKKITIL